MRSEGTYPIFTNGYFDLLVIMDDVDGEKIFDNNTTEFRAIQISHMPFIIIRFKKASELACYIDIFKVKPLNEFLQT